MGRRKIITIGLLIGLTLANILMARYVIRPLRMRQNELMSKLAATSPQAPVKQAETQVLIVDDVHPIQHLQEAASIQQPDLNGGQNSANNNNNNNNNKNNHNDGGFRDLNKISADPDSLSNLPLESLDDAGLQSLRHELEQLQQLIDRDKQLLESQMGKSENEHDVFYSDGKKDVNPGGLLNGENSILQDMKSYPSPPPGAAVLESSSMDMFHSQDKVQGNVYSDNKSVASHNSEALFERLQQDQAIKDSALSQDVKFAQNQDGNSAQNSGPAEDQRAKLGDLLKEVVRLKTDNSVILQKILQSVSRGEQLDKNSDEGKVLANLQQDFENGVLTFPDVSVDPLIGDTAGQRSNGISPGQLPGSKDL